MKHSLGRSPLPLFLAIVGASCLSLEAGYRPTGPIETWKLSFPTEVYSIENPQEVLGHLRKNQQVEVLDIDLLDDSWTVLREEPGNSPLVGTIKIPDQSLVMGDAFQAVEPVVAAFPLLKTLLESDLPWSERLDQLAASSEEEPYLSFWDTTATGLSVQESENGEYLQLKLWGAKDDPASDNPTMTQTILRQNFSKLTRAFDLNGIAYEPSESVKLSSKTKTSTWILPNDIVATVRYQPKSHLALIFESYDDLQSIQPEKSDPYEIADRMKARNYTSDGFLYLSGIPTVGYGRGEFGPYAPLTNVFAYYGYPAANRLGGFTSFNNSADRLSYANMLRASRRLCIGTPLHLRPIGYQRHESFDDIRDIIETGHPILLLSPGDLRIVTGYHPNTHEIFYSKGWDQDSGRGTMSWEAFKKHRQQLWILEP